MEQVLDLKAAASPPARVSWKRVRLGILLFILAALKITHLILIWSDNEARFNKIRGGMTAKEVVTILDVPSVNLPARFDLQVYSHSIWSFHDGTVDVDWNCDGTVAAAQWKPREDQSHNRSPFAFIRDLLRRIGL